MAKSKGWFILVFFICWFNSGISQPILENKQRIAVLNTANSQVGTREATGKNDGKTVEIYLKSVNLAAGNAWCCAFVVWIFTTNKITIPITGYCPVLFQDKATVVYKRNTKTIKPFEFKKGQVFGLYFESKKRVAHVGIITGETTRHYQTIEGNTNESGSREGDGVYKKIRTKETIYIISDFIKD